MQDHFIDWLSLLGRWAHIITGIAWIGSSFFFMWLDSSLAAPKTEEEGVEGELYLVHSGGYYRIHKKLFGHGKLPDVLHWFKWEAAFTVITGYFLLGVVYYSGGATFMVDTEIANLTGLQAISIGLGTLILSWFLYDVLWRALGDKKLLPIILTAGLIIGLALLFTHTLSGRAAYIHIGAMLGTWMVLNVWVHIIPNQKSMLDAAEKNETPNYNLGEQAKYRSVHNNYFTLPVIFIMISNHHPMAYGHDRSWFILALAFVAGAFIRHFFNLRNKNLNRNWVFIPAALTLIIAFLMTAPESDDQGDTEPPTSVTKKKQSAPVVKKGPPPPQLASVIVFDNSPIKKDNSKNETLIAQNSQGKTFQKEPKSGGPGEINGVVTFTGELPSKRKLRLPAACAKQYKGPVFLDNVRVNNNKLENVLVYISKGHEGKFNGTSPNTEVEVDQRGCIYRPRVSASMVGQKVTFINSDPVFHNVKTTAKINKRFNRGMPKKGQRYSRVFTKSEISIHAKCSLHPWMGAYIGVFDHPWFDVTRNKGKFKIKKLPPGPYTLKAWHEVFGEQTQEVTLKTGQKLSLNFNFK